MKSLFLWTVSSIVAVFFFSNLAAQSSSRDMPTYLNLPHVFRLGEYSDLYEKARPGYQSLLDACGGDMVAAHQKLSDMMKELEAFAAKNNFDINGIKAWMHFFFKEDGTIEHIGFHLKPNSKNINQLEFGAILKKFSKTYAFPLVAEREYAHYSTFSFPVIE